MSSSTPAPSTPWRVTMWNPDGPSAAVEQFPTRDAAEAFAFGVRNRHPAWEVDIHPVRWTRGN